MIYQEGYVYHIKDEYFEKVQDSNLMQNKEGGTYRPTFYCLRDNKTSLLWMVPLSSRVEKFKAIHDKQMAHCSPSASVPEQGPVLSGNPQLLSCKIQVDKRL